MKRYQLFLTAVMLSLLLGLAGDASAQQKAPKPPPPGQQQGPQVPPPGLGGSLVCGAGWHVDGKYDPTNFTCVPNKPAKITCPGNSEYFENKSGDDVCSFGCRPILH